jgi:hypothetical protein
MDIAYLEKNKREFELQKSISLATINGHALKQLCESGSCDFELPEVLFDLDHPGQYFRRIKAVRVTIPCVTGPHTNVSAKLSLLSSAIRKETTIGDSYDYKGFDDTRFVHNLTGIQSIATSSAQNDGGLFELNFRDERYLPFEGAGAVSRWRLELPADARQFDYETISDVVLHISYTARDAGGVLKEKATARILTGLSHVLKLLEESDTSLVRVTSLKKEFPDVLHQLLTSEGSTLELKAEHFPYVLQSLGAKLKFSSLGVSAVVKPGAIFSADGTFTADGLTANVTKLGNAAAAENLKARTTVLTGLSGTRGTSVIGSWNLAQVGLAENVIEDVLLVVNYTVSAS